MDNTVRLWLYAALGMLIVVVAVRHEIGKWREYKEKRQKKILFRRIRKAVDAGEEDPAYLAILKEYEVCGDMEEALKTYPLSKEEKNMLMDAPKRVSVDGFGFRKDVRILCRVIAALPTAGVLYIGWKKNMQGFILVIILIMVYQLSYTFFSILLQLICDKDLFCREEDSDGVFKESKRGD